VTEAGRLIAELTSQNSGVVGRHRELELTLAALAAHRHVVLEGPPGTGKSTLLRAIAGALGVGFEFVEGNAELTPARLVGAFDPARVLNEGYAVDAFLDGPLITAMRNGSLLYVEEINRIPEETLNVLITVMSEGDLHVPRLGRIAAEKGFRLVAAMNPFDAVGTARISGAVYDRMCRIAVGYQSHDDEVDIVLRHVPASDRAWVGKVVEVVRRTRNHGDLRTGSSVRGAIDIALVAEQLGALRSRSFADPTVGLDAAVTALSGRVRVREGVTRSAEEVVTGIWTEVFRVATAPGDEGKAPAPTGATNNR
jgi:MoxR-like ATPase